MSESKAKIEKVPDGIKAGNLVKIRGGETDGVDLSGFTGHVIRDEEVRSNGANGKTEPMVMLQVDTGTGEMSRPIDMPRRYLKGPKDKGALTRWKGKLFSFIRGGVYHRVAQ